jgi:hypothetical protein
MSKKPEYGPESFDTYFCRIFTEQPEYLQLRTYDPVIARFIKDHPGQEVTQEVLKTISTVKVKMRRLRQTQMPDEKGRH